MCDRPAVYKKSLFSKSDILPFRHLKRQDLSRKCLQTDRSSLTAGI